jgi:hypothetical protein
MEAVVEHTFLSLLHLLSIIQISHRIHCRAQEKNKGNFVVDVVRLANGTFSTTSQLRCCHRHKDDVSLHFHSHHPTISPLLNHRVAVRFTSEKEESSIANKDGWPAAESLHRLLSLAANTKAVEYRPGRQRA